MYIYNQPLTCTYFYITIKIFFGEGLPSKFNELKNDDLKIADLCITIGTSLKVPPFAYLPSQLNKKCIRLLINRQPVGLWQAKGRRKTDVYFQKDADDGVTFLVKALGIESKLVAKREEKPKLKNKKRIKLNSRSKK